MNLTGGASDLNKAFQLRLVSVTLIESLQGGLNLITVPFVAFRTTNLYTGQEVISGRGHSRPSSLAAWRPGSLAVRYGYTLGYRILACMLTACRNLLWDKRV